MASRLSKRGDLSVAASICWTPGGLARVAGRLAICLGDEGGVDGGDCTGDVKASIDECTVSNYFVKQVVFDSFSIKIVKGFSGRGPFWVDGWVKMV